MRNFIILIFLTIGILFGSKSFAYYKLNRPSGTLGALKLETKKIEIKDGRIVEVEAGNLLVAEDKNSLNSPLISIPFYRLKSKAKVPSSPIFLLAGGPGSSWIDRFENPENFDEVLLYQEVGDVIVFDQRGAGHSSPKLECKQSYVYPLDKKLDMAVISIKLKEMASECAANLRRQNINLASYNTEENVKDIIELRSALGYKKINLIGGSYGSHLALAFMRHSPELVERVVIYGVEGPDHTWDIPSYRLNTYERIAKFLESNGYVEKTNGLGIVDMLKSSIERLDSNPEIVMIKHRGKDIKVLVDGNALRLVAGFQAGRKSRINVWPEFITETYKGNYKILAQGAFAIRRLRLKNPMAYLMDCASGVSKDRYNQISTDPAVNILGEINFEYEYICESWKPYDLGESFRKNVVSDIPTLIIHGTWDTSTPIENAREVMHSLKNAQLVEVLTGSHGALYNLYENWEDMRSNIKNFLRGENVSFPATLTLPLSTIEPSAQKSPIKENATETN